MTDANLKNPEQPGSCLTVCWFRQNLPQLCSDSSSLGRVTHEILSPNSRPNNLLYGESLEFAGSKARQPLVFSCFSRSAFTTGLRTPLPFWSLLVRRPRTSFSQDVPGTNKDQTKLSISAERQEAKAAVSNRDSVSISSVWNCFSDRSGNCRKGCHKTWQDRICPHSNSKRPATGPLICDQDFWRERVFR